ncbi:hypothetical protein CLV78_102101 [Aliiruegeria haliotis]|uniref:Uncharacterized protein n=1 Tax=Aliiruegeria haliotis TaxID=1280846 RepID=A0A2T0RUW1_9RHOB|nr:hypothetical protein [Aliiruegeria haliotis]PRY24928.1 hypothetical protein CLV78_102101 [Aliiruegeria haliotis]
MLEFDITRGETAAARRNPFLFAQVVNEATRPPAMDEPKLRALYEAQNPNGIVRRYLAATSEHPASGAPAEALHFLMRFGGPQCLHAWPERQGLHNAIRVLETHLALLGPRGHGTDAVDGTPVTPVLD